MKPRNQPFEEKCKIWNDKWNYVSTFNNSDFPKKEEWGSLFAIYEGFSQQNNQQVRIALTLLADYAGYTGHVRKNPSQSFFDQIKSDPARLLYFQVGIKRHFADDMVDFLKDYVNPESKEEKRKRLEDEAWSRAAGNLSVGPEIPKRNGSKPAPDPAPQKNPESFTEFLQQLHEKIDNKKMNEHGDMNAILQTFKKLTGEEPKPQPTSSSRPLA